MSIAVVIPLYNGAQWIQDAIDSVLAQERAPDEIVVVDDGSTDDSPALVRAYSGLRLLANEGKGSSAGRNTGVKAVGSEFIAFLDQDDMWHPAHLRLLVEPLGGRTPAVAAVAMARCFGSGDPEYDLTEDGIDSFDPWTRFPFTIGVDGPSLAVVRRSGLYEIGLWEEAATGMGDALLFLKLASIHPLLRRACVTVGKRIHASQQWLKVRELGASYLRFRHDVMRRALAFRESRYPSDPALPQYQRRLEKLLVLRELTELIQAGRLADVPPVARELERGLVGEPPEYRLHAFYCLIGALFKTHDVEVLRQERNRVFLALLEHWPPDAATTGATLREIMLETPRVS